MSEDENFTMVTAFAAANVGHMVSFEFRARGTRTWLRGRGVINEEAQVVSESPFPGGMPETVDFPNQEFEYRGLVADLGNGHLRRLEPSPAPPRREQSPEGREILTAVASSAASGAQERATLNNTILQMDAKAEAQRSELLRFMREFNEQARADREAHRAEAETQRTVLLQEIARLAGTIATQRGQPPATTQPTAPATAADPAPTTIGYRPENDLYLVSEWQLTTPEEVRLKRLEVQQHFQISHASSPYRWRAFNLLAAWMDAAYEQPSWSNALLTVGVTAMETLRSVVAQEDQKVNAQSLFAATSNIQSDKLGDAISTLAKEAEKQRGRGRGRGRGGNHHHNNNNNNNNGGNGGSGHGRQQGNSRGPAQQ